MNIAEAAIPVLPDLSGFARELKRDLKKVLNRVADPTVDLTVDLDDEGVRRKLERLAADQGVDIDVDLDARAARSELERLLSDEKVKIKPDIDDSALGDAMSGSRGRDLSSKFGDWLKDIAAGGATGAIITGVGMTIQGVMEAMDRQALEDRFASAMGLDAANAEKVAQAASELYVGAWGENLEELYEMLAEVDENIAGIEGMSLDELVDIGGHAMTFADVFDAEVTEVTQAVGQALKANMADSAEEAFDILAWAFQNAGNRGEDFLESIEEYAPAFEELGLDLETTTAMIVAGLEEGAWNADVIADMIREFKILTNEGGDDVIETFDELKLSFDDFEQAMVDGGPAAQKAMSDVIKALSQVDDLTERNQMGVALFGTKWEEVGRDVIGAIDPLIATLDEVDGTMTEVADTAYGNIQTKLIGGWRAFTEAIPQFMHESGLMDSIDNVIEALSEDGLGGAIEQVKVEWAKHWPSIKRWLESTLVPFMTYLGDKAGQALVDGIVTAAKGKFFNIDWSWLNPIAGLGDLNFSMPDWMSGGGGGGGGGGGSNVHYGSPVDTSPGLGAGVGLGGSSGGPTIVGGSGGTGHGGYAMATSAGMPNVTINVSGSANAEKTAAETAWKWKSLQQEFV